MLAEADLLGADLCGPGLIMPICATLILWEHAS